MATVIKKFKTEKDLFKYISNNNLPGADVSVGGLFVKYSKADNIIEVDVDADGKETNAKEEADKLAKEYDAKLAKEVARIEKEYKDKQAVDASKKELADAQKKT